MNNKELRTLNFLVAVCEAVPNCNMCPHQIKCDNACGLEFTPQEILQREA